MPHRKRVMKLAILGLMTAVLILMAATPLGYLNIGPLAITFNMIPVAICAITVGPAGGAAAGAVFGMTSFLQCMGIMGTSALGVITFNINPFLTFVQRMVPRVLDGFLLGYIFRAVRRHAGAFISCSVTGFFSAFLNTLFFMTALILLFGRTQYMKELIGGKNIILFVCSYVGINAIFEMIAATVITGAIGTALSRAGLTTNPPWAKRRRPKNR